MLRHWDERPLRDVLAEHGLTGTAERPFPNDGWSGAALTSLRRTDGAAFILKRSSWAVDWIARSTRDHALREGFIAATPLPLPYPLVVPYHGAGAEGTSLGILMPDLSGRLLAWELGEPPPGDALLDRCLDAIARLHAAPWPIAVAADADAGTVTHVWPMAPLVERLCLLGPRSAARLASEGTGAGVAAGSRFLAGWAAFDRLAPRVARDLVSRLDADPGSLVDALGRLPRTGLHGDLKLSNLAPLGDGRVALIDWQMTMLAPVAVELGWLLVSNSGVLRQRPEIVIDRYRAAIDRVAGEAVTLTDPFDPARTYPDEAVAAVLGEPEMARFRSSEQVLGDWDAQVDLAAIVGLLLRGWRKGLDAEAGATLPSGIAARDDLAWWCDRAVEAAARRLGQPT